MHVQRNVVCVRVETYLGGIFLKSLWPALLHQPPYLFGKKTDLSPFEELSMGIGSLIKADLLLVFHQLLVSNKRCLFFYFK